METPKPGTTIGGKYRLLGVLGQGGMGTVFEAEHNVSGKHVAVKWMHLDASRDPEAAQRFIREARATAKLQHPNVVDVYDVESTDNEAYLVMERLKGQTFSALLQAQTEPLPSTLRYLIAAMRGVEAAHDEGVVHRDIKPDNIFLAQVPGQDRPVPKVLDFGISKVLGSESLAMTRAGAAMGTPQYMSLEQLYGQRDVDLRADIYAFGVMLFEAATGQLPYNSETITELAVKMATTEPPDPKTLRPDLPNGLCDVIARAMARDRDERHGNLAQLIADIEPYTNRPGLCAQGHPTASVKPISLQSPPQGTRPAPPRKRQAAFAAIVALLLILAAITLRKDDLADNTTATPHVLDPEPPATLPTVLAAQPAQPASLPEGELPPQARQKAVRAKPRRAGQTPAGPKKRALQPPPSPNRVQTPPTPLPTLRVQPPAQRTQIDIPPPAPPSAAVPRQPVSPVRAQQPLPARGQLAPLPTASKTPIQTPQAAPFVPARARQPVARGARRIPAIAPQRELVYPSVVHLKAAYRNRQLSRTDYKHHTRALKLWRKQAIVDSKQLYRQRLISKAEYKQRVNQINHIYKGR